MPQQDSKDLVEELIKRELESANMNDPVVQRALAMLPASDASITYAALPALGKISGANVTTESNAWVNPRRPSTVFVPTWTQAYKAAAKGDEEGLRQFASILGHERHHVSHGPDEASAYDEQLALLHLLGASDKTLKEVEKAKTYVLGKQK